MMVSMWCSRCAHAFGLKAVYDLSSGILPKSAEMAFTMVSLTNRTIGIVATPCSNPLVEPGLRCNPCLNPFHRSKPLARTLFQRTIPTLKPVPITLQALGRQLVFQLELEI